MKKILAILLAGVMSVTAFGFNAAAVEKTDAEIQQEKLGYILNLNKDIWLDCAVIYDGVWPSIMDNAREVYDTDGLSADECLPSPSWLPSQPCKPAATAGRW